MLFACAKLKYKDKIENPSLKSFVALKTTRVYGRAC